MKLRLHFVAVPAFALSLLFCGCGSEGQEQFESSSELLSGMAPLSPAQGDVIRSRKVTFSGRSSLASGSAVTVTATDAGLATHSCTATVAKDQTWSCTQQLNDGGYTWSAAAANATAAGINFAVSTRGLAAPTIDQTQSPTKNAFPVLTGTSSEVTEFDGDETPGHEAEDLDDIVTLNVSENGKTVCTVKMVMTSQWSCALTTRLADGTHVLTATVTRDNSTSPRRIRMCS
jgi:hypothetical protein